MPTDDQNLVHEQHFETDEALQEKQNALISYNTKVTVFLGALAVILGLLALVAEVIQILIALK